MSKTDKTRPVRVQVTQGDRTFYAHHSIHCVRGEAPCTLPEKPSPKHHTADTNYTTRLVLRRPGKYWVYRVKCDWWPDPYVGVHGKIKSDCGCRFCTGQGYRKHKNRRNRRTVKAQLKKEQW